jgi:hypothetical protein
MKSNMKMLLSSKSEQANKIDKVLVASDDMFSVKRLSKEDMHCKYL